MWQPPNRPGERLLTSLAGCDNARNQERVPCCHRSRIDLPAPTVPHTHTQDAMAGAFQASSTEPRPGPTVSVTEPADPGPSSLPASSLPVIPGVAGSGVAVSLPAEEGCS